MKNQEISFCLTICSRRRPELIATALNCIAAQKIPSGVQFSVLIVENDVQPSYGDIIARFSDRLQIHYETEPEPGLTHVRNRALTVAEELGVDWIGSIDDDVTIPADWLAHMVAAIRAYPDTQIFYGNWIRHNHPDEPAWHPDAHHYNKHPTGKKIKVSSFNNIAVKANVYAKSGMALRFDHSFRFVGGEDTDFSRAYLKQGGVIRSVHEALAEESLSAARSGFKERMARASAAEYSAVKIRHKHDSLIVALFWSVQTVYRGVVLGGGNIVIGFLALPFNELWGLKRYGIGRRLLANVHGVLRYYFGSEPSPYGTDRA